METIKCRSIPSSNKSKIARTFQKVINLKTATRIASNNGIGICMFAPQNKFEDDPTTIYKSHNAYKDDSKAKRKALLDALVAKVFAGITTIKAAYAELQMAQNPYSSDAIHAADQAVVEELKLLSELKRSFFKNDLDHLSPQVTLMLANIQEQQSLMKTYEITIKKLEMETEVKESDISALKKQLDESIAFNKSLEKKLNESGPLSMFDNIQFSILNPTHFVQFLHSALRSMRSFVKLMVREMDVAHWDIEAAAKAIEPESIFAKPTHRCFVFESFVSKTMFEGFNHPNFMLPNESPPPMDHHHHHQSGEHYFNKFKKLKSVNPRHYLTQNPISSFARFTRAKYLQLVHAKMECSLFGNLNQRKLVNSGGFPDSAFFTAFLEMARRVWSLNLLAFSFGENVSIFQVSKNSRFSEVYMESVTHESLLENDSVDAGLRVDFTVVPGFMIGNTVIQSQVYLSPAASLR
ncbi:protein GRAVITROPIC IN THE LIGHT 1 isoform X2 [Hevea brasiliensis]|nr:protein GRAVITROPIC IN THE LIGHT 1 isoform X2 [Hevea brasiliensis]